MKVNESIIMIKWCRVIGQYQRNCRIQTTPGFGCTNFN